MELTHYNLWEVTIMAKSKSGYCAAIDKLPWILRLIFALPVLDGIIYGIYRICSGVASGSVLKIVMGIVWIFAGAAIFWIIDIICVIICGKVTVLA